MDSIVNFYFYDRVECCHKNEQNLDLLKHLIINAANFHYEAEVDNKFGIKSVLLSLPYLISANIKNSSFCVVQVLVVWARLHVHPVVWRVYVVIFYVS